MSEKKAKNLKTAIVCGSFCGATSTLLFQPLDLVKTRIQINKGHGLWQSLVNVWKTDKVRGLWKGVIPSLYRTVPGVGIYYGCLHVMDAGLRKNHSSFIWFTSGATARSVAALCLMPANIIKIRFESGCYKYKTVLGALKEIWSTEGFNGLYRGSFSTILRDAPFSGIYLMFYGQIKDIVKQSLGTEEVNSLAVSMCGLLSGLLASLLTHPADVVKTSIQASTGPYSNLEMVQSVFYENGIQGFFKGFAPRATRRTLMAATTWTIYEKIMSVVGIK
ncbi:mitochondrial glycine transporter-like [Xenia sp. Carnegie-2017]|uniref:mitochondrial glycine transporter-like n=1 Tax=Xenia sp. Carnegie-2017 TaxID=2897299 RepID=UPI001F03AC3B|nr:mitochondrial glycine transporter-like [Xenia sp. Carnegie-2017]